MNRNEKPKRFAQNQTHKMKNFAYLAGKPTLPKSDGLPNNLAKPPAENSRDKFCKLRKPKYDTRARTIKSQRLFQKDLRGQTDMDFKNDKPKTETVSKDDCQPDRF